MKCGRAFFWSILLSVIVIFLLFYFSGQTMNQSNDVSRSLAQELIDLLGIECERNQLDRINLLLRKAAHFTLFLLLGLGLSGVLSKMKVRYPVRTVLILGAVIAAANEGHQYFSDGRSPSIYDVCLDELGATMGIGIFWLMSSLLRKRQGYKKSARKDTEA